jgi:hypothetical protein
MLQPVVPVVQPEVLADSTSIIDPEAPELNGSSAAPGAKTDADRLREISCRPFEECLETDGA